MERLIFLFLFLSNICFVFSQKQEKDISNFILTYYNQDGKHSAVTGGEGTESLQDRSLDIMLYRNIDSLNNITFTGHINYYSSASSDNIDSNVSSASKEDIRTAFGLSYGKSLNKNWEQVFHVGGSMESDYLSLSFGTGFTYVPDHQSYQLTFDYTHFRDTWQIILPEEIRSAQNEFFETNKRRAHVFRFDYRQSISTKLEGSFGLGYSYQFGLLSTPFHRVYFLGQTLPRTEKMPGTKWTIPISMGLRFYASDYLILKSDYRYYVDAFKLNAHTASIEFATKLSEWFRILPSYRYHTQDGAYFFSPFKMHHIGETYYSSDFDISPFSSQRFGLGLYYSAPEKVLKYFSVLGFQYYYYKRSDGLSSHIFTTQFSL